MKWLTSFNQLCLRSSSSIPRPMTNLMMTWQVSTAPDFSGVDSFFLTSILDWSPLLLALGSQRIDGPVNHFLYRRCISHVLLRAWRRVIQIWLSVGIFSRDLFKTLSSFSYVSKRARASQISTLDPWTTFDCSRQKNFRVLFWLDFQFNGSFPQTNRIGILGMCSNAFLHK